MPEQIYSPNAWDPASINKPRYCLFLYSGYWFMAFTIKMPLTVNICLCFYLTHTSSSLVMVHPSHCFGGPAPQVLSPTLDLSEARHTNTSVVHSEKRSCVWSITLHLGSVIHNSFRKMGHCWTHNWVLPSMHFKLQQLMINSMLRSTLELVDRFCSTTYIQT